MLRRTLGNRLRGWVGGFSPAQFFAQGGTGLWLDGDDPATLFQDSAGTTPATTNGAPIGLWKDKSGAVRNYTAAATVRPTLSLATLNGKPVITYDGVNDILAGNATALGLTNGISNLHVFAVGAYVSPAAADGFVHFSRNGSAGQSRASLYVSASLNVGLAVRNLDSGSATAVEGPAAVSGEYLIQEGRFNVGAGWIANLVDGELVDLVPLATTAGPFPSTNSTASYIGGTSTTAVMGGGVAEVVVYAGDVPDSVLRDTQTYLATKWGIVAPAPANELLVVMGQSNAWSEGVSSIPPEIAAIDPGRVKIWTGSEFEGYVAGTNSEPTGGSPTKWGPEAQYAVRWLEDHPVGILWIVKRAVTSTTIATWQDGQTNFDNAEAWVDAGNVVLDAVNIGIGACNLIWCQGESDAIISQGVADAYYGELVTFLASARAVWGVNEVGVMRIYDENMAYGSTVRAAQEAVCAETPLTYLINTDDLTLVDTYHYNTDGVIAIGERMYDAITTGVGYQP